MGASPQILSETLYALVHRRDSFVPDEIVVCTTAFGRDCLMRELMQTPRLQELARMLNLTDSQFQLKDENLRVFHDNGRDLTDLRSQAELIVAANQIVHTVAELTADENSQVHASLAGGRKTMSFYLGHAMSLFGRSQDELSHVLVNAPFEGHHEFYFPPDPARDLALSDGGFVSTKDARVELSDVPFLRLGDRLDSDMRAALQRREFSFKDSVAWAQLANEQPRIHIRLTGPDDDIWTGGGEVRIGQSAELCVRPAARELAFLLWFALARKHGDTRPQRVHRKQLDWHAFQQLAAAAGIPLRLPECPNNDYFDQCRNALKSSLLNAIGPYALSQYMVNGQRRRTGLYGLYAIDPEDIHIDAASGYTLPTSL